MLVILTIKTQNVSVTMQRPSSVVQTIVNGMLGDIYKPGGMNSWVARIMERKWGNSRKYVRIEKNI